MTELTQRARSSLANSLLAKCRSRHSIIHYACLDGARLSGAECRQNERMSRPRWHEGGGRRRRGSRRYPMVVGDAAGRLLEQFTIEHSAAALASFVVRVEHPQAKWSWPVAVAMEAFNGGARPLGRRVLLRGCRLFNINNLNLARDKKLFPTPAKTDPIGACCMVAFSVALAATGRA